ncbi:hypothetical protein LTR15_007790 [Elasticomyces elasticus]|nr:hypothetical protein LTR15_007790 [Elasticomyces elasticus]
MESSPLSLADFQPARRVMDAGSNTPIRIATSGWKQSRSAMETDDAAEQQCALLSLSPEMRNKIYELAFTSNAPEVDSFKPAPPTKALLLSCKKVWQEAKGLHKAAYRTYYESTTFVIEHSEVTKTTYDMPCTDEDLSHMRNVALLTTAGGIMDRFAQKIWIGKCFDDDQQVRLERSTLQARYWHEKLPPPEADSGLEMRELDDRADEALMCCVLYSGKPGGAISSWDPNRYIRDESLRAPAMTRSEVETLLGIELQG